MLKLLFVLQWIHFRRNALGPPAVFRLELWISEDAHKRCSVSIQRRVGRTHPKSQQRAACRADGLIQLLSGGQFEIENKK